MSTLWLSRLTRMIAYASSAAMVLWGLGGRWYHLGAIMLALLAMDLAGYGDGLADGRREEGRTP